MKGRERRREERREDGSCRGWRRTKTSQNTQTAYYNNGRACCTNTISAWRVRRAGTWPSQRARSVTNTPDGEAPHRGTLVFRDQLAGLTYNPAANTLVSTPARVSTFFFSIFFLSPTCVISRRLLDDNSIRVFHVFGGRKFYSTRCAIVARAFIREPSWEIQVDNDVATR